MRYVLLSIFILLVGCSEKKAKDSSTDIKEKFIDFTKIEIRILEKDLTQEITKNKQYLLLENNLESFMSRVDKIAVKKDKVYISDRIYRNLLIFSLKDGSLISKFNREGEGPEEYRQISDFTVDENDNIHIIDGSYKKHVIYDENLNFVSSKKLELDIERLIVLDNGDFLLSLAPWNTLNLPNVRFVLVDSDFDVKSKFLEFDKYVDLNSVFGFNFSYTPNGIAFNRPIENRVFHFDSEGTLDHVYTFDFGPKNVTDEVRKDLEPYLTTFSKFRYLDNYVIDYKKHLIGSIRDGLYSNRSFILDKERDIIYLEKEKMSLELLDSSNKQELLFMYFGIYDDKLISIINPNSHERATEEGLPTEVVKHLQEEGYVICVEELR